MIRTVLVPLDGSPLSEHTTTCTAQSYLAGQANSLIASGLRVETIVDDGDAPARIPVPLLLVRPTMPAAAVTATEEAVAGVR